MRSRDSLRDVSREMATCAINLAVVGLLLAPLGLLASLVSIWLGARSLEISHTIREPAEKRAKFAIALGVLFWVLFAVFVVSNNGLVH